MENVLGTINLQKESVNTPRRSEQTPLSIQLQPIQIEESTSDPKQQKSLKKVPTFDQNFQNVNQNDQDGNNIFHIDSPRRHMKNFGRDEQVKEAVPMFRQLSNKNLNPGI